MTINIDLLDRTLAHIEANPQEWDQAYWRCGTGMCFAGHAAALAGGEWLTDILDEPLDECLVAEESDGERAVGRGWEWADRRATRVLGLSEDQADRLFHGGNTLDDLRRIVAELKAEAASEQPEDGGR